jgi:hypothetical protein
VEIDRDDSLYCQYLREPWFHDNVVNEYVRPEKVLGQFERIFNAERQILKWRPRSVLPWRALRRRAA